MTSNDWLWQAAHFSDDEPIELRRSAAPRRREHDDDVVLDSGYDVVEEVNEPTTAAGAHAQIARILTDAASLRESGSARRRIPSSVELSGDADATSGFRRSWPR